VRRFLIGGTLILILASVFQLSRLAAGWHFIVPGDSDELVYATTFSDAIADWEQDEGQLSSQVVDGVMQLSVELQNDGLYSAVEHHFSDFDITVDTRAVTGNEDNGYGIVFRQLDRENYYMFHISTNGFYRVTRLVDGSTRTLSTWVPSPLITTGFDVVNQVRVVANDDQFRFYINDTSVELCIPDNPDALSTVGLNGECLEGQWTETLSDDSIGFGRLGVTVVTDGMPAGPVIAFDNVLVYGTPISLEE